MRPNTIFASIGPVSAPILMMAPTERDGMGARAGNFVPTDSAGKRARTICEKICTELLSRLH